MNQLIHLNNPGADVGETAVQLAGGVKNIARQARTEAGENGPDLIRYVDPEQVYNVVEIAYGEFPDLVATAAGGLYQNVAIEGIEATACGLCFASRGIVLTQRP